jgi:ribonucleoside-diphosphate reductase alpha chain
MRPRPQALQGKTYEIPTPVGDAFITINSNGDGDPFEVFVNVGKRGSDLTALAEALGRTISMVLRMKPGTDRRGRAEELVDQLGGIGGRGLAFSGGDRICSLPDAVAYALAQELEEADGKIARATDVFLGEQEGWAYNPADGGR